MQIHAKLFGYVWLNLSLFQRLALISTCHGFRWSRQTVYAGHEPLPEQGCAISHTPSVLDFLPDGVGLDGLRKVRVSSS